MPPLFHFCRGHAATAARHGRASESGGMAAALLAPEHCGSGGGPAGATAPSRQIVGVRRPCRRCFIFVAAMPRQPRGMAARPRAAAWPPHS